MHNNGDVIERKIKQQVRLDNFQSLVHQRRRVNGHQRPHAPGGTGQLASTPLHASTLGEILQPEFLFEVTHVCRLGTRGPLPDIADVMQKTWCEAERLRVGDLSKLSQACVLLLYGN